MTKSQLNQDLNVLSFFNNMKNGFFIDIGAYDGITLSNTYLLEKGYNWTGICSEPIPSVFEKLKKNRNTICDDNAVFSESELKLKFSIRDMDLLSGITDFIDSHLNKNENYITVNTITLQDLLKKYNAPKIINYLSLDTEGSEFEILKSVNFTKYIFLYINVEHNYIEPRRTQMRSLLENNGYIYKKQNHFDDDYIHISTIIGIYFFNNDYSKPITISNISGNNFLATSDYWPDRYGQINNGLLCWDDSTQFGNIFYNNIKYGDKNIWYRDNR